MAARAMEIELALMAFRTGGIADELAWIGTNRLGDRGRSGFPMWTASGCKQQQCHRGQNGQGL
jgi:hypothetical protein